MKSAIKAIMFNVVGRDGFEPSTSGLRVPYVCRV